MFLTVDDNILEISGGSRKNKNRNLLAQLPPIISYGSVLSIWSHAMPQKLSSIEHRGKRR